MPNHCAGLVVQNLDGVRPFLAAIVGPSQETGQTVFGTLEPFKADDCRCCRFRPTKFNGAASEPVNILARHRWLFRFGAALDSDGIPRIRYVAVKFAGIQAMHDAPCAPA